MDTTHVWNTYSKKIRKYIAARITGPAVDDVLQQVFLRVHTRLSTLTHDWALQSWLYRITHHSIIDRYRKEQNWSHTKMHDAYRDTLEKDQSQDNQKKIYTNIESCLVPMIDSLDPLHADVMKRTLDPDMTYAMIAQELWISESYVKVIVHRSKKKLKASYEQCCYQYTDWKWHIIDTWCSNNCGCANSVIQ